MFGYSARRTGFNWVIIAIGLLVGITGFTGHNSVTGEWDWSRGFDSIAAIVGGGTSFLAILGFVLVCMGIVFSVKMVADRPDVPNIFAGLVALVLVVLALFIGNSWIQMPPEALWILVAFIVLVTLITALVTPRSRSVVVTP